MRERVNRIVLPEFNPEVLYLIICQGCEEINVNGFEKRGDVLIVFRAERGLSKSRNVALDNVTTEYAYIMDDDVVVDASAILALVRLMRAEEVDVGTAQHRYENGLYPVEYKKHSFVHNILTVAKVSSIDICVKVNSLRFYSLKFDEGFGLGTSLPSGEEFIFLSDCLKKDLHLKYYPVLVGLHPNVTSGMDFFSSPYKALAKREMIRRVFGWKAPFFIFAFWLKKSLIVIRAGYFYRFSMALLFGKY